MAEFQFEAEVIHWRGPSPFFFAPVPARCSDDIKRLSTFVSYGWGMIPIEARIGGVTFSTSLFPKNEAYLLPLKANVRQKLNLTAGDMISVEMTVQPARR
ncbi:DUF1905 domain-containing protein [Mesorhizobium loti]|nr:DUF1905 domain-containing protein [Mesorhizobium loti]PLP60978.1 DUF1905 domain-containing protein [Mesorhizobium loti]